MTTLYLDCFCGISGDMAVGALIDAGADFDTIREAIASLGLEGCRLEAEKVKKQGIMATQFHVIQDPDVPKPHRHLRHVAEIISRGDLPDPVRQTALETFELLARAEAAVHGCTVEQVHFHEVGAIDSIVDIVAAQLAMHLLGVDEVYSSALHVGAGTVECDHGVMPVPAPATAKLLEGKPVYGGAVQMELVTPTGAALVAQRVKAFGEIPLMAVERIGYGSGTRDVPGRANVLRVMLGARARESADRETIGVIETHIDDMNPELFPPLIETLLHHGARDAYLTPTLGKKGRPAYGLTVLCDEAALPEMARRLFQHSTTFGLRFRREERLVLERQFRTVQTPWGSVRIKMGYFQGEATCTAPEFEDCRARAEAADVPLRKVYEAALSAALKGAFDHA
jgi:pyridinium-3,5-bisthiocarboxylic acid mononucleotide nickel chelatase